MTGPLLVAVVDAIPYAIARRVWMEGCLPGFPPPSRLISCFPSLTQVALPSMVRGIVDATPPGYEQVWYDAEQGRLVREAAPQRVEGLRTWPPLNLLTEAALYALPLGFTWTQARWLSLEAPTGGAAPWLGYISATDAVAHLRGSEALREAFRGICAALLRAREAYEAHHGVLPRAILCSDHGIGPAGRRQLHSAALEERLAGAGFEPGGGGARGVVVAGLGAVGSGALHGHPAFAAEAAETVALTDGVELAAARIPDGAELFGVRDGRLARARILWRGEALRYEPLDGDPLGLEGLAGPWWQGRPLFQATASGAFPDALHRLREGLTTLVRHPATVLFSMEPGWSFGPLATHAGAAVAGGMLGTHGALHAEQSLGFALDSAGRLPPYLRIGEIAALVRDAPRERLLGAGMPWDPEPRWSGEF